ncbi:GatB/YqeY domain-containing protein [Patescibacteria group bacterium]|nr:MAG: GatB/YqeY domain-containing protein [Patescibacteria group bacterium]
MKLKDKIFADLTEAAKQGDGAKRDALRLLFNAIKNTEIEKLKRTEGLTDEETIEVIARAIKQRRDSIEQFEQGQRTDLADKERAEIEILAVYMPEQLSAEAVEAAVREVMAGLGTVSEKDMGRVMGAVMARLKGKADGTVVREMVQRVIRES